MKTVITFLFLLISITSYTQSKYDTTVRKKYIDSLKYQLSSYTIMSYSHLNLYDKAAHERDSVIRRLDYTNDFIIRLRKQHYRTSIKTGIAFIGVLILSFVMVVHLSK